MSVETVAIRTDRGDDVTVTLFDHAGQEPTVMITVVDADDCVLPTAEFTLSEVGELREVLRALGEKAARRQVVGRAG